MSETEIMGLPSELFTKGLADFCDGRLTRVRARVDSVSLARDPAGDVCGLLAEVAGSFAAFPLCKQDCEALALALAPWLQKPEAEA